MKIKPTIIKIAEIDCGECPQFIGWVKENFTPDYTDNVEAMSEHLYHLNDTIEQAVAIDVKDMPEFADDFYCAMVDSCRKLNVTYFRLVLN